MKLAFATLPLTTLFLLVSLAKASAADVKVEITEWKVPWSGTRPRDPYVGPQGHVWFVGQRGDYVARFDPGTGSFKRFDLESGTGPHNNIVDRGGFVWYAGNLNGHIGRLDPKSGRITKYVMPDPDVRDPHTLVFDGNGDIWFTAQRSNFIGKLMTKTGNIRVIRLPTPRARPYGIAVDSKNRPWFNEFGTNKIGTVNPTTMRLNEYTLPRKEARSRRLAVTSVGIVWYVDYAGGFLGRLDPATAEIKEWAVPGGDDASPYAMTIDHQDRLWFVETGLEPNRLVGFDQKTQKFFSITEIESGGGSVRHMVFHKPSRQIWFGTDRNTIGRAQVPYAP